MNYKIFRKPVFTFLLGIFLGTALVSLYAFNSKSESPPQTGQVQPISLTDAVKLTSRFTGQAKPFNAVLRGFAVTKDQLEAMNMIFDKNPQFNGIRLYMGQTKAEESTSIVVGINKNGDDATSQTIYNVSVSGSGPCPTVCDYNSPL